MKNSRIFLLVGIVFLIAIGYASYDIGSRTTFPGSKSQLKERIKDKYVGTDTSSIKADTSGTEKSR